jgi:transaldolase/glucose-6-phosphate isomerase
LNEQPVLASDGTLTVHADDKTVTALPSSSVLDALRAHLARAGAGDYIALLDYIEETPENESIIQQMRTHLRDTTRCATTTGYGPRFLHSTGQLHKGGPDTGVFIQVTAPDRTDLPIPNQPYTFSILKQAQALGDFRSLSSRGRRAIRVDLGADTTAGLRRLRDLIAAAVPRSGATTK